MQALLVKLGYAPPGAVNLIGERMRDIIAFLDDLTYGEHSSPGLREMREAWQAKVKRSQVIWGSSSEASG